MQHVKSSVNIQNVHNAKVNYHLFYLNREYTLKIGKEMSQKHCRNPMYTTEFKSVTPQNSKN